jgi:hypothetical protein
MSRFRSIRPRERSKRERSKGVAVLELTLSLVFLIPLLLATLDFGYYFYIGATVEEAARQGVQQAVALGGPCPAAGPMPCPGAVRQVVENLATSSGTTCAGAAAPANPPPAVACYLNGPPLNLGSSSTNLTVTCECSQLPFNPTYIVTVRVDFPPALGYFRYLMPNGSGTNVRYRTTLRGA